MKTAITIIVSLLIGAVLGGALALGVGSGMGAGGGLIVGSQAGACLATETARQKGLITAPQADEIISGTVGKIRGKVPASVGHEVPWVGSEADCARMITELENGTAGAQ